MDLLVATLAPQYTKRNSTVSGPQDGLYSIVMFLLSHAVSFFATYLSWNCSTAQGLSLAPKLAWAGLAYCFGFIYILFHAFKFRHACLPIPMPLFE